MYKPSAIVFFAFVFTFIFGITFSCVGVTEYFLDNTSMEVEKPNEPSITDTTGQSPTVLSIYPSDGSTDTLSTATITITFSKTMNINTLSINNTNTTCSKTIQVSSNNFNSCLQLNTIVGDADAKVFTITTNDGFIENKTYKIRILRMATDTENKTLQADFVQANGFLIKDMTPPTVNYSFPLIDNSTNLFAINNALIVEFSESMMSSSITVNTTDQTCSGSIQLFKTSTPEICVQLNGITSSGQDTSFTFKPTSNLQGTTNYTIKIATTVKDPSGLTMTNEKTINFTTKAMADNAAPSVSSVTSGTNIDPIPNPLIFVTFNEPMNRATVEGAFSLQEQAGNNVNGTFSWNNNTMNFIPNVKLKYYQVYNISVSIAAKDLADNLLTAHTSSFTTRDIWSQFFQVNTNSVMSGGNIASNQNEIYVTWSENNGTADQIYVKKYTAGNTTAVGASLNTNQNQNAKIPVIQIENNVPYVSFYQHESDMMQNKINTKSFNGSNWNLLGVGFNSANCSLITNIYMSFDTNPYILYEGSGGCGMSIEPAYYTGSSWSLSSDIFSSGTANFSNQILRHNNKTYVAYTSNQKAFIKTHESGTWNDSNSWTSLAGDIMNNSSTNNSNAINIEFNESILYVAYTEDNATDGIFKLFVKKFNGTTWDTIGSNFLNENANKSTQNIDIATVNNEIYVTWMEHEAKKMVYIKKWNSESSQWERIGHSVNYSKVNDAEFPKIVEWDGEPVVLILEGSNLTVMNMRK